MLFCRLKLKNLRSEGILTRVIAAIRFDRIPRYRIGLNAPAMLKYRLRK